MKWTWHDSNRIAAGLLTRYPETDPLSVTLVQLQQLIIALPEFADDPEAATDAALEAIQEAWYDAFEN